MLLRLGESLRVWRPSTKAIVPLDAVRAGWSLIVGAEVAKHCTPVEIRGETLVIVTRSGTWSQQLGFLEAEIVAAIERLTERPAISELKFRVGRVADLKRPRPVKPARAEQTRLLRTDPPEATLEQMIVRAKHQALLRQRARGPRCRACGLLLESGVFCAPCRRGASEAATHGVMRALTEAPWLEDAELRRAAPRLRDEEIAAARRLLLERWRRELDRLERTKSFSRGEPERATAVAYVLLATRLPPDRLSRAIMKHTLGPRLDALLYNGP